MQFVEKRHQVFPRKGHFSPLTLALYRAANRIQCKLVKAQCIRFYTGFCLPRVYKQGQGMPRLLLQRQKSHDQFRVLGFQLVSQGQGGLGSLLPVRFEHGGV